MIAGPSKLTLSVFTADIGGFVGHISSHPGVLDTAKERLYTSREKGRIEDFHVLRCGDDVELIVTHRNGVNDRGTHELVWNTLADCREESAGLKLHASEQGLSREAFTGSLRGMGPGVAEMEFIERTSEPVVVLMSNKAATGSWNLPLYKIFADPFNTSGLVLDPSMLEGFSFKVRSRSEGSTITLSAPKEAHYLLALIGLTGKYVVTSVCRNTDGDTAAVVSSPKLRINGGSAREEATPAAIFRCQAGFPATGEVMEALSFPHLVEGWMRNSHNGPLMPVPFYEANPTRFDGPPRVIAAGFQITNGRLIGPHDMFDDPAFDGARRLAGEGTEYLRRHGPFQPHLSSTPDYSAVPFIMDKLKERFKKI